MVVDVVVLGLFGAAVVCFMFWSAYRMSHQSRALGLPRWKTPPAAYPREHGFSMPDKTDERRVTLLASAMPNATGRR